MREALGFGIHEVAENDELLADELGSSVGDDRALILLQHQELELREVVSGRDLRRRRRDVDAAGDEIGDRRRGRGGADRRGVPRRVQRGREKRAGDGPGHRGDAAYERRRERTILLEQRIGLRPARRQREVGARARLGAGHRVERFFRVMPSAGRVAVTSSDLRAFVLRLEDEVDHAADRIGAVDR